MVEIEPDRLAAWQQGDFSLSCKGFISCSPHVEHIESAPLDGDGELDTPFEVEFDESVSGLVLISQTCDVVRNPETIPNVSVCPLVRIDKNRKREISKGLAPRYGLISHAEEDLVVDFSRVMSVSKKLLINWDRQRGCPDERTQLDFSRSLESFFGRFAFPDEFVECLQKFRGSIISKYTKDGSELGAAFRDLRELRVYPHGGWSAPAPIPLTFFLIADDKGRRKIDSISEIDSRIRPELKKIAWNDSFLLHDEPMISAELADFTAADYLNSYPIDINSLSNSR